MAYINLLFTLSLIDSYSLKNCRRGSLVCGLELRNSTFIAWKHLEKLFLTHHVMWKLQMVHERNPINLGLAGEQRPEMSSSLRSLHDTLFFICGLRFADYLKRLSISVLVSISLLLFLHPPSLAPRFRKFASYRLCLRCQGKMSEPLRKISLESFSLSLFFFHPFFFIFLI